jgi:hypothetical protein
MNSSAVAQPNAQWFGVKVFTAGCNWPGVTANEETFVKQTADSSQSWQDSDGLLSETSSRCEGRLSLFGYSDRLNSEGNTLLMK